MTSGPTHSKMAGDIWSVADLLRGDYKRHEYGQVILPFTLLRRLDAVMASTRDAVRTRNAGLDIQNKDHLLRLAAKLPFYNTSEQDFATIGSDPARAAKNLRDYINGFSPNVRQILARFDLDNEITRLAGAKLLYRVVGRFAAMHDLDKLSNHDMGYVFEHLIRKFAEDSNETAGEHFTPARGHQADGQPAARPGRRRPCRRGSGDQRTGPGMRHRRHAHRRRGPHQVAQPVGPSVPIRPRGQRANRGRSARRTCSCASSVGTSRSAIRSATTATRAGSSTTCSPTRRSGWSGRRSRTTSSPKPSSATPAGSAPDCHASTTARSSSCSTCSSTWSRWRARALRLAIVFNGSPLFTGAAESGESRIRQWILENDLLEGIVALPDQLFYNTGISTYFWILSNRKVAALRGKVILLDARDQWEKMRKSLGDKRKQISDDQIAHITKLYGDAVTVAADADHPDHAKVKIFRTRDFGYHRITVERPLKLRFEITDDTLAALENAKTLARWSDRDALVAALRGSLGVVWWTKKDATAGLRAAAATAGVLWPGTAALLKGIWAAVSVVDPDGEMQTKNGEVLPDPDLRDYENIPLDEDIDAYFAREVTPHVPDAWIDHTKTKVGYEIPFTRHFYVYTPPRPLAEIDAELRELEEQIQELLGEVAR